MELTPTGWRGAPWQPRRWQAEALEAAIGSIRSGQHGLISAIMGAGKSVLLAELIASVQLESGEVLVVSCPTQALVKQLAKTLARRVAMRDVGFFYADFKHLRPILVTCNDSMPLLAEALTFQGLRVPLWIADEAHRTETPQVKKAFEQLGLEGVAAIGLTATPFRSNRDERLSLWDSMIYRYSAADAVADGVIVPWRVKSWTGDPEASLDEACVEMILAHRDLGPGVANARTIKDADAFAARLVTCDVKAATVHSGVPREETVRRIEALRQGDLDIVVYVSMLAEGVDMPWLRWMCLRRKVGAEVRFAQEAGRIIRADEGKTHGLVLDPINLFSAMDFATRESVGTLEEPVVEPPPPPPPPPPESRRGRTAKRVEAEALTEVEAYLKQVAIVFASRGQGQRNTSPSWRRGPGQPAQRARAQSMIRSPRVREAAATTPDHDRGMLRAALGNLETLSRGALDDLNLVLEHLDGAAQWLSPEPDPSEDVAPIPPPTHATPEPAIPKPEPATSPPEPPTPTPRRGAAHPGRRRPPPPGLLDELNALLGRKDAPKPQAAIEPQESLLKSRFEDCLSVLDDD